MSTTCSIIRAAGQARQQWGGGRHIDAPLRSLRHKLSRLHDHSRLLERVLLSLGLALVAQKLRVHLHRTARRRSHVLWGAGRGDPQHRTGTAGTRHSSPAARWSHGSGAQAPTQRPAPPSVQCTARPCHNRCQQRVRASCGGCCPPPPSTFRAPAERLSGRPGTRTPLVEIQRTRWGFLMPFLCALAFWLWLVWFFDLAIALL